MRKVLFACLLLCCPMVALAQDAASTTATDVPDFIKDIFDSSFSRYVDFDAIGDAWDAQDPAMLTDRALELAEGERILFRSLRKITSETLFEKAIALATDQKDVETLDRIAKYAAAAKKDALANAATTAKRLAGAERSIMPAMMVNLLSTPLENFGLMKALISDIDKARANGNKVYLVDYAKALAEEEELKNILTKPEVDNLKKYAEDSEKMTAESNAQAKETEDVLDKLAGESRISSKTLGIKINPFHPLGPIQPTESSNDQRRAEEARRQAAQRAAAEQQQRQAQIDLQRRLQQQRQQYELQQRQLEMQRQAIRRQQQLQEQQQWQQLGIDLMRALFER